MTSKDNVLDSSCFECTFLWHLQQIKCDKTQTHWIQQTWINKQNQTKWIQSKTFSDRQDTASIFRSEIHSLPHNQCSWLMRRDRRNMKGHRPNLRRTSKEERDKLNLTETEAKAEATWYGWRKENNQKMKKANYMKWTSAKITEQQNQLQANETNTTVNRKQVCMITWASSIRSEHEWTSACQTVCC